MSQSPWIPVNEQKPATGVPVIGRGHGTMEVLVWHPTMGDCGKGGDFASVKKVRRGLELSHVPNVTEWQPIQGWDA